jgi:Matrixin
VRRRLFPVLLALAIATLGIRAFASDCVDPPLMSAGIRPGDTLAYAFVGPWPNAADKTCVEAGIAAWNTANAAPGGSGVAFVPVADGAPPDITVNRIFIDSDAAGNTTDKRYDDDGYVTGFGVQITTHTDLVSDCTGLMKVALHEFGHGQGLGHPNGIGGSSVMNNFYGTDDEGGNLPLAPTDCDEAAVAEASLAPQPEQR